jgi:hypothetical protein
MTRFPHRRASIAAITLGLALLGACRSAAVEVRERPDPWVFRSVLDGNARMLSACLDPDLWIAWDVERAKLHRVWSGGVVFTGAVYDSLHGPQPLSRGPAYMAWPEDAEFGGWSLATGEALAPAWLGYRLIGREGREELHLMWHIERGEADSIQLSLIPSAGRRGERIVLELRFVVEGLGPEEWIAVELPPAAVPAETGAPVARETSGTVVLLGDRLGIGPQGGRLRLAFDRIDAERAGAGAAPDAALQHTHAPAEEAPVQEAPEQAQDPDKQTSQAGGEENPE